MRANSRLIVIAASTIACVFSNAILADITNKPNVTVTTAGGTATLTWDAAITGPANVEHSQDLSGWITISTNNSTGTFQHASGSAGKGFYQLRWENTSAPSANMITVQGGILPQTSQLAGTAVATFEVGKYEVTWDEWQKVRSWAVTNGYTDLAETATDYSGSPPGRGSAANHPVREVSWFDVVKWCNARSEMEGFTPVYLVDGATYRTGQPASPTRNSDARGYRLPTEAEWEWAARGGVSSQGFTFSGSNEVNVVAWNVDNSMGALEDLFYGRGTWPVGLKLPNELAIYDMTGNVWEWCWDAADKKGDRRYRGGSYGYGSLNGTLDVAFRNYSDYQGHRLPFIGFRLARNAP
jgi:formylglycine-generating enzyme required for sulfatase activity